MSVSRAATAGVVGRDEEIAALELALDGTFAGQGGTVLLAGEPGVGKSRLVEHLAERGAERGATVLWGHAWEAGGAPPFWPWIEVLRALIEPREAEALRALLGHGAADIAQLVPELADRMVLPAAAPRAPGAERFRLFDAVSSVLARAAVARPIVIVLEDLHVVDESSLLLLVFVAPRLARGRALVVGTYRDVEARLSPEIDALLAKVARHARSLTVRRLDRAAVCTLVADAGLVAGDELVERVYAATEGNPLFVTEVMRLLRSRAAEGRSLDTVPIPDGVRGAIREHVSRLGTPARALLEVGAVVGRDFTDALIAEVIAQPIDDVRGALADAIRHDVVRVLAVGRYRFAHALVRDVLYDDTNVSRRTELHVEVAQSLERLYGRDPDGPFAEIARHFARAGAGSSMRAVDAWVRASQRAGEKLALDEAVSLLEQALATIEAVAPQDLRRRMELSLALGSARMRAGRMELGGQACVAAAALARELGSADDLARAALAFGARLMLVSDRTLTDLLRESLQKLPTGDGSLRARAMARLAAAQQPSAEPEMPMAIAREALAMARRLDDRPTLLAVLSAAGSALAEFAPPEERREVDGEMAALATELGDSVLALRGHARLVIDCYAVGDLDAAEREIDAYERCAAEFRQPHVLWQAHLFRAIRPLLQGRFDEARQHADRASEIGTRVEDGVVEIVLLNHRWSRGRIEGRPRDVMDVAPLFAALHRTMPSPQAASGVEPSRHQADWRGIYLAAAERDSGNLERARALFEQTPHVLGVLVHAVSAMMFAELCWLAKDVVRAEEALSLMVSRQRPEHLAAWGTSVTCEGPMSRAWMLLSATAGRWDDAERYYEQAHAHGERLGARPFLARIELDWAHALSHRARSGDVQPARELAASAAVRAEALAMDEVAAEARELASGASPPPSAEMAALSAQMQESKLASLADLVAGIAHEINNPLGALQSTADVSRRAVDVVKQALDDPEVAAILKKNEKLARALSVLDKTQGVTPEATSRIAKVVTELRRFARLDRAEIDRVDLRESLEATIAMLGRELGDGRIEIVRHYDEGVPTVRCRPRDVHEALLHVLRNAAQSIGARGVITLGLARDREHAVVTVADDGHGISSEHLPRVFDPGFTTRGVGVGIGLGLSIVYRVIREHGGTVEVASELGTGTVLTLCLPLESAIV